MTTAWETSNSLVKNGVSAKFVGTGQTDRFHPHHAKDENGITHWWLQDELGNMLDVTIDQFLSEDRQPPYVTGRKGWFLKIILTL